MDQPAPRRQAPTLLEEGYYLVNLERVLSFVLEHHAPLLHQHEALRARHFLQLSLCARRLYTRLYMRRGPLFRASLLSYPEIPRLPEALSELARAGFVALLSIPADLEEAKEIFSLFSKEGLLPVLQREIPRCKSLSKEKLVEALVARPDLWQSVLQEKIVSLLERPLFSLFELLFFGNRHQSLTEFILVDIAQVRYPRYSIQREPPLFPDRSWVERYLQAAYALNLLEEELPREVSLVLVQRAFAELERWSPPEAHRRRIDPGRYWVRLAFYIARQWERGGHTHDAKALFEALSTLSLDPHLQAESIDRFGLLCQRLGEREAFSKTSDLVLSSPSLDALSRYQIEARRARLGLGPDPKDSLRQAPTLSLTLTHLGYEGAKATYRGKSKEALPIELAALEALGGDGLYAENFLFLTLFGLLCWEVLFAPLPGVFVQPFQSAPLDLFSDDFYARREALFANRFHTLTEETTEATLRETYQAHFGEACSFISWELYTIDQLVRAAKALGPTLPAILRRIAQNPARHSNGLPDLLLFEGERASLLEVKGPGDTVRLAQKLWHDYLLRSGASVKLVKVLRAPGPSSAQ